MRHVTLIARRDESTGEIGLVIEGLRVIDYPMVAHEGLQIAHDLLEHQQGIKRIGTIGDELIALGGVWYVRGQHADLSRNGVGSAHSAEANIASDVANMGTMYVGGDSRLHAKVPKRAPACDAAESIREILRIAAAELRAELRDYGASYNRAELARYLRAAYRLMCKGFNRARYRFERALNGSRYYANNLFWEIAEAIDPHAKHCEYEGQRFQLSYGNGEAYCREVYEDEQW